MNKQAFVNYTIDVTMTIGVNLVVFASIALALDKAQNYLQLRVIVVFLIIGFCCVIFGAILSFIFEDEDKE